MKNRREIIQGLLQGGGAILLAGAPWRLAQAGLSQRDALAGLREALQRGAQSAVEQLGRPDGFLSNARVHIPLPDTLRQASGLLRAAGQGKRLDELETAMNRAAEAAVPQARPLLVNAIKSMTVQDAQQVLGGGDTSVTDFFAGKTREPLTGRFLPVVRKTTARVALAQRYEELAGKASKLGLMSAADADVAQYVTGKALDGLFLMIGEEEKRIRQDPVGTGSALLRKVFGGL